MKVALLLVLAATIAVSATYTERQYQTLFTKWVDEHSRVYESSTEFFQRYEIFKATVNFIDDSNSRNHSYTLGTNQFSDMTVEEFAKLMTMTPTTAEEIAAQEDIPAPTSGVPAALDWVSSGKVSAIKNQGQCGSCWAFASTSAMESAAAVAGRGLVSLSEQQLIDCAGSEGNGGCNGGSNIPAFNWVIKHGGQATEQAYPYHAKNEQCRNVASAPSSRMSKAQQTSGEGNILNMIQAGPVAIGIAAGNPVFQNYKSGILDATNCPTNRDHAVVIVAYGHDQPSNKNFWRVRNSWGTSWGAGGYIWMRRGTNLCAVESDASQPKV